MGAVPLVVPPTDRPIDANDISRAPRSVCAWFPRVTLQGETTVADQRRCPPVGVDKPRRAHFSKHPLSEEVRRRVRIGIASSRLARARPREQRREALRVRLVAGRAPHHATGSRTTLLTIPPAGHQADALGDRLPTAGRSRGGDRLRRARCDTTPVDIVRIDDPCPAARPCHRRRSSARRPRASSDDTAL